jgi:hypothetical protein
MEKIKKRSRGEKGSLAGSCLVRSCSLTWKGRNGSEVGSSFCAETGGRRTGRGRRLGAARLHASCIGRCPKRKGCAPAACCLRLRATGVGALATHHRNGRQVSRSRSRGQTMAWSNPKGDDDALSPSGRPWNARTARGRRRPQPHWYSNQIQASFSSVNWGEKYCIRIPVAFRLYLVKII